MGRHGMTSAGTRHCSARHLMVNRITITSSGKVHHNDQNPAYTLGSNLLRDREAAITCARQHCVLTRPYEPTQQCKVHAHNPNGEQSHDEGAPVEAETTSAPEICVATWPYDLSQRRDVQANAVRHCVLTRQYEPSPQCAHPAYDAHGDRNHRVSQSTDRQPPVETCVSYAQHPAVSRITITSPGGSRDYQRTGTLRVNLAI